VRGVSAPKLAFLWPALVQIFDFMLDGFHELVSLSPDSLESLALVWQDESGHDLALPQESRHKLRFLSIV
jgi:hypothetical protein